MQLDEIDDIDVPGRANAQSAGGSRRGSADWRGGVRRDRPSQSNPTAGDLRPFGRRQGAHDFANDFLGVSQSEHGVGVDPVDARSSRARRMVVCDTASSCAPASPLRSAPPTLPFPSPRRLSDAALRQLETRHSIFRHVPVPGGLRSICATGEN